MIKAENSKLWKCLLKARAIPCPTERRSLCCSHILQLLTLTRHRRHRHVPARRQRNLPKPQRHSVTSSFILIPSEKFKNYTKKYFSLCYLLTKNTPQNYKLFSGLLEFWFLVEGVVCTFWVRNEFTGGRRRKGRKSDNGIWHYIFSYAIQLFIMMPVRTEEFCPHLHPLVSMYAKWRTKLPNAGEEGVSS